VIIDPVVAVVDDLSKWAWNQVDDLGVTWLRKLVFVSLQWPDAVVHLYDISRNIAWALAGVMALVAVIRSMWPDFSIPGGSVPVPLLFERLVVAGLISLAGLWGVQTALAINNAIVTTLLNSVMVWQSAPSGVLSPVLVLVVALAMIGLMLYLAVFYALRAIEIYMLTAAIPWFALWWAGHRDDAIFSNLMKELTVVVFVQSFHAAAFWLVTKLMAGSGVGVVSLFMELALLWYMTKMPGQFRRLIGAGIGRSSLWR